MITDLYCKQVPEGPFQLEGAPLFSPRPNKPLFSILTKFDFTWVVTPEQIAAGEDEPEDGNTMTLKAHKFVLWLEQAPLLDGLLGLFTLSYMLFSYFGLPPKDCFTIAKKFLSCARETVMTAASRELIHMELGAKCFLENDDVVDSVKESIYDLYCGKVVKAVEIKDKKDGEGGEVEQCSICLEDISADSAATAMPCNHVFHHHCISPWLMEHPNCPLCRDDPIHDVFGGLNFINYIFKKD